jgi:hypothetical protein
LQLIAFEILSAGTVFPLSGLEREKDILDEAAEPRNTAAFLLRPKLGNELADCIASRALRHLLDEADDPAFLDTFFVPEPDPATALFPDSSC